MPSHKSKIVLSDEQIVQVEALAACLSVEQISDYFGFPKMTFYRIMDRQPDVMLRYKKGKATAIGHIAQGLIQQARAGNTGAAMFYLKTQGGWRERDRNDLEAESEVGITPVSVKIVMAECEKPKKK